MLQLFTIAKYYFIKYEQQTEHIFSSSAAELPLRVRPMHLTPQALTSTFGYLPFSPTKNPTVSTATILLPIHLVTVKSTGASPSVV